jgi:hypothetical protein
VRDWLYNTITAFANDVSVRMGNRITKVAEWCNSRSDDIERARMDTVNYINYLMQSPPWPFDQALLWFWGLVNNSIVTPAFNAARSIFVKASEYIVSFFEWNRSMYIPERWLRDIIYNIRDRLINLLDDTATLVTNVRLWATGVINDTRTALQGSITLLENWKRDVSTWIGQNLYLPLQAVILDIVELGATVTQLDQDIRAVTRDPVDWMWSRLEPVLRQKVTDWLNSIWYTRI